MNRLSCADRRPISPLRLRSTFGIKASKFCASSTASPVSPWPYGRLVFLWENHLPARDTLQAYLQNYLGCWSEPAPVTRMEPDQLQASLRFWWRETMKTNPSLTP